jgi:hypothetical protein
MAEARFADAKPGLLEVTHMLKKKGAKAKEYWAEKPGAPCEGSWAKRQRYVEAADSAISSANEEMPSSTESKLTKVQESSSEAKGKPSQRIRRYLHRLFKRSE